MKKILAAFLGLSLVVACASQKNQNSSEKPRSPSAYQDISGTYLGEGLFQKRSEGLKRPAMRIYIERAENENAYYGVLVEYDYLLNMSLPYIATQKAPILNKVVGYLNNISTRISAFKMVAGSEAGTYDMFNLAASNGNIVVAKNSSLSLRLHPQAPEANPLAGAEISGLSEGRVVFPDPKLDSKKGFFGTIGDAMTLSEYELAKIIYKVGKLASTWRGNWNDLEGSYLSEYGRFKDGVLELASDSKGPKMQFIKTNKTKAKYFTNPKSATIEGKYRVVEPIKKMYVLIPESGRALTASDKEMSNRIGLFLDVFDASAPEAGGHMVTELAFTNPQDPEDFMMYYEHPEHVKNVGVEPK